MADTPNPTLTDTAIAQRIRAGRRCQLCPTESRPAGALCWDHHDALGRILDPTYRGDRQLERAGSIPVLWAALDPTPARAGLGSRAPGYGSHPPLRLDHVVLRDPRSVGYPVVQVWHEPLPGTGRPNLARPYHEDERPLRSVPKSIGSLADALWDDLGYPQLWSRLGLSPRPPARTVAHHCRWMHSHLADITARDDAGEIAQDLTELHDQLRPAAGDPRPEPDARCTGWVRDPTTREKVECTAPLYLPPPDPGVLHGVARPPRADPSRPVLRCRRCDRPYTHLMLLRQQLAATDPRPPDVA